MSDEWYTHGRYIEAARQVMGSIDLDPASCSFANGTVKATHYYAKDDNGLEQAWSGNVWLNPPFSRRQTPGKKTGQGLWINRLVNEYLAGHVSQAILLTTCRPDAKWFGQLWDYPICFCDHKVGFYTPEAGRVLQEISHAHGTLFVYLGPNTRQFIDIFGKFGVIAGRISPPAMKVMTLDLWSEVAS